MTSARKLIDFSDQLVDRMHFVGITLGTQITTLLNLGRAVNGFLFVLQPFTSDTRLSLNAHFLGGSKKNHPTLDNKRIRIIEIRAIMWSP